MFSDIEIGVFLDELEEKLQVINDNLLILENEPDNQDVLNEIFRAAHTIKGSSGVMGYEKMASLTHNIENLFDMIRQGKLTVTTEMINVLFEALDTLNLLKKEVTGESVDVDISDILNKISGCMGGELCSADSSAKAQNEAAAAVESPAAGSERRQVLDDNVLAVVREAQAGGLKAYQIAVTLAEDTQMKSVRAFLVFEILQQMGEVISSNPPADELQQGSFDLGFEVVLLTKESTEKVQSALMNVAEVDKVEIRPVTPAEEAENAAGHQWQILDDNVLNVIREAEVRGFQAYQVAVILDEGTQMKSVRAFLVFETLQQMGEVIKSTPPAEELQEGNFDRGFEVVLLTQEDQDKIQNTIMSIAEVNRVELRPVSTLQTPNGQAKTKVGAKTAAPAAKKSAGAGKEQPAVKTAKTVRVDVQKLDNLMNLVGELVIDRTRLNRFAEIFEDKYGSDELVESINEIANHLGQVTGDLQEQIMKARMLPIAQIFNRFPRMVRDTAQKLGKEIDFIVEGKETELDRNVIEVIGDPLIHLIRNSIDHGIEPPEERERLGKPRVGKLHLKASYHESHIVITISDDGRGIDADKLRQKAVEKGLYDRESASRLTDREALELIFKAGFSTAKEVSDLSGRGVGMDVVRTAIEQINGMVELHTEVGVGTTFTIRLPLTLAIIRSLMVTLGEQVYAFPLSNVSETLRINAGEIRRVGNNEVIVVRERILPLLRLSERFGMGSSEGENLFVVVIASAEKRVAVVVDKLLGEQEIVIKSLGEYLGEVPGLSGATILGDGRVALIIDSRSIIKDAGMCEEA
ncbi:two-component system chemotaxis sensor kinase CheA [Desulfohalotomaculum tongense]|uniref:chemotaxis protein CheW n=1 Tax=Desulforadius tongensis TaxID=1216062 RepID=UPI001959A92F|nr:two-component system chemotaxis sensor kinase CheA [Desulforadius tongensis]